VLSYMICSTPRVGSQLLAQLLTITECAGAPAEFFEPAVMANELPSHGFPNFSAALRRMDDYVAVLRGRHTTPNGVFGLKAHTFQFERAAAHGFALARHLPRVRLVHLTRRDRVAQAVSFDRALQTRSWNNFMPAAERPVYDRRRLDDWIALIERWDARWREVFAAERAPLLSLTYEDLAADRAAVLDRVARFLDLDVSSARLAALPAWFQQQSDGLSRDWIERYRCGG
jgi:trehalose 2-sulfotransferase